MSTQPTPRTTIRTPDKLGDQVRAAAKFWKHNSLSQGLDYWREGMRNFIGQVIVLDDFGNKYVWSPVQKLTFPLEERLGLMGIPDVMHPGTLGWMTSDAGELLGDYTLQVKHRRPYENSEYPMHGYFTDISPPAATRDENTPHPHFSIRQHEALALFEAFKFAVELRGAS